MSFVRLLALATGLAAVATIVGPVTPAAAMSRHDAVGACVSYAQLHATQLHSSTHIAAGEETRRYNLYSSCMHHHGYAP
jgi:hypothetical protein